MNRLPFSCREGLGKALARAKTTLDSPSPPISGWEFCVSKERTMTREIPLSQGKVALVDDADYDWLNQWNWFVEIGKHTNYVMRRKRINGTTRRIRINRSKRR